MPSVNKMKASQIIIILLFGLLSGIAVINARTPGYTISYKENYQIEQELKAKIQEEFKKFYVEEYCGGNTREVLVNSLNVVAEGLYCDKPLMLMLDDGLPTHLQKINE